STLTRHSMLARKGAIWRIRLKLIEQSVGMPLEMSAKAWNAPPVGRVSFIGAGLGREIDGQGGRSNICCRSAETGMSSVGIARLRQIGLLLGETTRRQL